MKLIIVDRRKPEAYERLKRQFADDLNVEVLLERRVRERRRINRTSGVERRARNRRKFAKAFDGRDYIVIYIAG